MLQVKNGQIVDVQGQGIRLRGTCVGGWMNMENFIDGYPGAEHTLRAIMADEIGDDKAKFFFDRWLDYFFAEDDIAFIRSCGANVVRLPLNYRHFESDAAPFRYLEPGFDRLNRIVEACAKHSLYVILDLHSVQGWQNNDWHCDNNHRQSFFWTDAQYQDRFVGLWEEFARRYKGNATIAGYNVMNEPFTYAPFGRFDDVWKPKWDVLNTIYRRVVAAIRAIDPDHIIFLEGDRFAGIFAGLDAPFADNLVYSSHLYTPPCTSTGSYPGTFSYLAGLKGDYWDAAQQERVVQGHEGTVFAHKHNVPLWVGEFGMVSSVSAEVEARLQALRDEITIFDKQGIHWTTWTYKDVGMMGWTTLDPQSAYMQTVQPILDAKAELRTDIWQNWLPPTRTQQMIGDLARHVEQTLNDPAIVPPINEHFLAQQTLDGYVGTLAQYTYARRFKGMTEEQLDDCLQSFALRNCKPNTGLIDLIKSFLCE